MTTKAELGHWFDEGVKQGASHMIIFVDTYDYENYAIFTQTLEEAQQKIRTKDSMTQVSEVYNLSKDKTAQLNEPRVHNLN